ncbi:hypothetical protein [Kaarinaea lacus]
MFRYLIVCGMSLCLGFPYAHAGAVEQANSTTNIYALDLSLPKSAITYSSESESSNMYGSPLLLAAAEQETAKKMTSTEETSAGEYKDRTFTGNKIHKYLGIGSIGAALLTLVAPKEEDGAHEYLALTSAALALGAVGTGLAYHYEDISMAGGIKDPDNLHALWAGLGAVAITAAAATGPDVPHATFGALGTIAMMVGVKYTW